jgi:hypothetical protein
VFFLEQSVWLYVGIIAGLIGLGFVASIAVSGNETGKQQALQNTLAKFKQNCDFVCSSDIGSMFKVDVTFVSGMKIYSEESAVCVDFKGSTDCRKCDCRILDSDSGGAFLMDFSSDEAKRLFDTHEYSCFMERKESGVAVECKG